MTLAYVYGTFYNLQYGVDPGFTRNRLFAKWRSQIPVRLDLGLKIVYLPEPGDEGFYTGPDEDRYIPEYAHLSNVEEAGEDNFSVKLVTISDLDYQIKAQKEVDDFFWIWYKEVYTTGGKAPNGRDFKIVTTQVVTESVVNASNPNSDRFSSPPLIPKPTILPTYIDFAPIRLELGYDYGAVGGPEFKTEVVEVSNGRETRNSLWHLPLGRWQLGDRVLVDSEQDNLAEIAYLKEFHANRKGSYQGFRFKDWSDYYTGNQYIATGDGVKTEFQLRKAYRAGDAVTYRPIQKPVFGTVDLFVDGINVGRVLGKNTLTQKPTVAVDPNHEWKVNHDTGVISHLDPLPEGAVLSANFEFDVPVWFESDEISFNLQAYEPETRETWYRLGSVFVVEGRIPLSLPWQMQPGGEINEPLDLGIIYDTTEKHSFSTDKLVLANNFARREIKREDTKNVFDIGDRVFDREELDRLLGYFYCARGQSKQFPLNDKQQKYLANWSSDRLNIKFSAANTNDALFNISELKLNLLPIEELKTPVFLGFTAASGAYGQRHKILSATFQGKNILAEDLFFKGASYFDSNEIILTTGANYKAGAFYLNREIPIYDLLNLRIYFSYVIDLQRYSGRDRASDGLAFVFHPATYINEPLTAGGAIGYQGVKPSVAIEFDTYLNDGLDLNNNHVAINIDGNLDNVSDNSQFSATPDFDIRGTRYCWIQYRNSRLEVYLSQNENRSSIPLVTREIDWTEIFS